MSQKPHEFEPENEPTLGLSSIRCKACRLLYGVIGYPQDPIHKVAPASEVHWTPATILDGAEIPEAVFEEQQPSNFREQENVNVIVGLDKCLRRKADKEAKAGNEDSAMELATYSKAATILMGEFNKLYELVLSLESDKHVGNEWADMAVNGVQWLKNIRDGFSSVKDALAEMESNAERIRILAKKGSAE